MQGRSLAPIADDSQTAAALLSWQLLQQRDLLRKIGDL
jgi:hypothetical protein